MSRKKILSIVMAVLILSMNVLPFFAVSDADDDAQKYCICGRPYYTQTTDEHNIYECVNCGNARSNCICKCWCGAETTASDEVAINGVPAHICSGCGQLCAHCTCGDREAVLKLEEQVRLGNVFAQKVEKPDTLLPTLLALIFVAAVAFMYAMYSAVKKNEQTKEKLNERNMMMRKHKKILEKIDEQSNYTASAPSAARIAAEKAINWDADMINPATIAAELSNAVHGGVAGKELLPFMRFIAESAADEDTAEAAALNGAYGSVIQLSATVQKELEGGKVLQEISGYFDNDYFYNNEQAIHKILGDYGIGSAEADTLVYLPCSCEVRFGSTAATAARWAEESLCNNESNGYVSAGKRFAERYLTGGGRK